ncbi:MAG: M48 family metallopeptidase [Elusimicrobiaceae bacterium]|nr:M48 family metallopeptidase [Elusimicrobiaceae bacterium]MBP5617343.1 M48 family metallopeptidase [Elusimicrobiaceae bacterium]
MADTQTTISDVKLFLERLKKDLPEIFGKDATKAAKEGEPNAQPAPENTVLFNGDLFPAQMYLTPDQEPGVAFDGKAFHVYLQTAQDDPCTLVTDWLKNNAQETLTKKTADWAQKMGVEFNQIFIKDQRTLWASCSGKKNLNFSYRIVKMPPAVQDYLMVHELGHLTYMNHGAEYWALVAQFCPDYKIHRRWLNENRDAIFADVQLTYTPPQGQPGSTTSETQPPETSQETK